MTSSALDHPFHRLAETQLLRVLRAARKLPGLRKRGPGKPWRVAVTLVSAPTMERLNARYRKRNYATDILSFPAPEVFRVHQGQLGELIVCLPVLRAQARETGHDAEVELLILLTHGVLHLLGLDHEEGARQTAAMARWEAKLLRAVIPHEGSRVAGLIGRAGSAKAAS